MTEVKARQIVLAARSQGKPQLTDFRLEETAIPTPSAGRRPISPGLVRGIQKAPNR